MDTLHEGHRCAAFAGHSHRLWAEPDVCGLFLNNVGSFSANVGLSAFIFSRNVGPAGCLWAVLSKRGLLRTFGDGCPEVFVIQAFMQFSHFWGYRSNHFFNSMCWAEDTSPKEFVMAKHPPE